MKQLLLQILIVLSFLSKVQAQIYSCVIPGQKIYFTNTAGYLRGMRIDSTRLINGNTVYYPFKTARLRYQAWTGGGDTAGGSWLGKEIVETPDGYTFIPNLWGDTIRVNNKAGLGESWLFLRDSTAIYYEATVIAVDTMTVGSIMDSVKIIRIKARNDTAIINTDPLHQLELVLSKSSGWLQVPDLYLFPYHAPGATFYAGFDCYFFEINDNLQQVNASLLTFRRIDYTPAYHQTVYDYEIGNIFETKKSITYSTNSFAFTITRAWVRGKEVTDTSIRYNIDFRSSGTVYPGNAAPYPVADSGTTIQEVKKGLLNDTTKMPEEWFCGKYYYFKPEDSSFCYKSALYSSKTDVIFANGSFGGGGPEPAFAYNVYKVGLGDFKWDSGGVPGIHQVTYGNLVAAQKDDKLCDPDNVLGVKDPNKRPTITLSLFPNPANSLLYLELETGVVGKSYQLGIYNILGQRVIRTDVSTKQSTIDIHALLEGIYWVRVMSDVGSGTRKFIIRR